MKTKSSREKIKFQCHDLDSLPHGITIGIYGAGKRGRIVKDYIRENRKDIHIKYFIDSFRSGTFENYDLIKAFSLNPHRLDVDLIIIISAYMVDIFLDLIDHKFNPNHLSIFAVSDDFFPRSVMISHQPKFIYVPCCKVAHSSFRRAFYKYCPNDLESIDYRNDQYASYYKFAFVRNPHDRFVSFYSKKITDPKYSRFFSLITGLDNFGLDHVIDVVSKMKDGASDPHWASQSLSFCDEKDRILVNSVHRFEALQSEIKSIEEMLGITIDMPHLNPSKRCKDYLSYFSNESRSLILNHYRRDFANFSYH